MKRVERFPRAFVHHCNTYYVISPPPFHTINTVDASSPILRKRLLTVKSSFHYDDGEEIDHCVTEKQKQKEDKKAQRLMAAKQENETLYPQIPADLDDEVVGENETQVAAKNDRPVCIDTFQREPFVVRFYSKTTGMLL